jgi:6-phosphogluconolactonase/glucosamine-6-phosphate isomerase/deaminase
MSVDYSKCDVVWCDEIFVSDTEENYAKNKNTKYWQNVICPKCSVKITEEILDYDEDEDCYFLKEKFFQIKGEKIILDKSLTY